MKQVAREIGVGWALPLLAVCMVAFTLVPAEAWRAPTDDVTYTGFDPNLVSTSARGDGSVQVSAGAINMAASGGGTSSPGATLATTAMRKVRAKVDVVVPNDGGAFGFGLWSPWTDTGQFVVFGGAPQDIITFETLARGGSGPTLIGGDVTGSTELGRYQPGSHYQITMSVDREAGLVSTTILGGHGTNAEASVRSDRFPVVISNAQLSLSASIVPGPEMSTALLRNYSLTLPHQRPWASKGADPVATVLLVLFARIAALLGIVAIAGFRPAAA